MKILIPNYANAIIKELKMSGFDAYVVGGCVRDSIIGLTPNDWDICTNALPEEVCDACSSYRVFKTGIDHGTVTVVVDGNNVEVTTFRTEGEYLDNRRPNEVTFINDLKSDLKRRDFTINSLAYNDEVGIVDYFGGYDDIISKTIRCVGNADERFSEDALRVLRALRFSSVLRFEIEEETKKSIYKNYKLVGNISKERIASELSKLIVGDKAHVVLSDFSNVIFYIIPEISHMYGFEQKSPHHMYDVWEHTLKTIEYAENDLIVRLVMLFHDSGKPFTFTVDEDGVGHFRGHEGVSEKLAGESLRRLRFSKSVIKAVESHISLHDLRIENNLNLAKKFISKYGFTFFERHMLIKYADTMGQNVSTLEEKLSRLKALQEYADKLKADEECLHLKDLKINGNDLINLGIKSGIGIGKILDDVLDKVIKGEIENSYSKLVQYVEENCEK